jgi:hypothetical protein
MGWAGHVASMGERREAYRVLVGKSQGTDDLKYPGVGDRIILKGIFEKWNGGMDWIELAQDRNRWWVLMNTVTSLRVK